MIYSEAVDDNALLKPNTIADKRIVIVEDDCDDSEIIRNAIEDISLDYAVVCLDKGETVIQYLDTLLHNELPRLIILDYNLAAVTALDVLKELKARNNYEQIPVVIYSNSSYPKHKEECLKLNAHTFFTKSNTIDKTKEDVKEILTYCL